MEACNKQTNRYQLCLLLRSNTLTSEIIAKTVENHSEFCGCANSCNKLVSSRSLQTIKLPVSVM